MTFRPTRLAALTSILFAATALSAVPSTAQAGETVFSLGIGLAASPEYEGSEDYEATALPLLGVEWTSDAPEIAEGGTNLRIGLIGAGLSFPEGASVDFLEFRTGGHTMTVGAGAGYDMGRDAGDSDALTGMGDIDGYLVGKLGIAYQSDGGLFAGLDANQSFSGDDRGATVDMTLGFAVPLSKSVMLKPAATAVWASEDHMQSYFGVSASQASASGYNRFDAGSGFKSVGVGTMLHWAVSENWGVLAKADYARLIGDAADSPLVDQKGDANQYSTMTGLSYRF